jgi:hypothetical protein
VATAITVLPASRNRVEPAGTLSATFLPSCCLVSGSNVFLPWRFIAEEIERNSAPVVLLRQPLILKVCKIPANGVRRNLQLFNEVADTDLTMFTNDIKQVFLTSGFMHLRLILQNVAINRILQHFAEKGILG